MLETDGQEHARPSAHRRERGRRARTRRSGSDAGFSFIDVIISITLLGIVVIPMINAVWTAVASSSTAREAAEIETALQNAADRVNRAPVGCDYLLYVQAAAQSKGWPASRASATYQYYVPGANAAAGGTWAAGACPSTGRTPNLVQLVTIKMSSQTGKITRTIKVVKSDV